jgi:hypothetical protein
MYIFQKSGNIKNISNIANAGVRKRYGSAFAKIFDIVYGTTTV